MGTSAFRSWFMVGLYAIAGAVVVGVGRRIIGGLPASAAPSVATWQAIFVTVVAAVLLVAVVRRIGSRVLWEGLFTMTVFLGIWFVTLLIIPIWFALAVAVALTLLHLTLRNVVVHDLFYLVGCVGVAINLAGWLPSEVLVAGLVCFTIYDMVAGFPGGPIAKLAGAMTQLGIIPGFILPARFHDVWKTVDAAVKTDAALLGAGDVILPLALVARAAFAGVPQAAFVLCGALIGALVVSRRRDLHPRAALPPLAAGTAIPFLILYLIARF